MFYSQFKQDRILETYIFKGFRNGVFVDVGASDGVTINNTLFFEKERGWTGLNIEPLKEVYDQLVVNRPECINIQCAIANRDGREPFYRNFGYTEGLSGLQSTYDQRHYQRLQHELHCMGGSSSVIDVQTRRLKDLFREYDISHIHYLSIDVEGAEFDVLQSIDFSEVFIDVIGFENNYRDNSQRVIDFLEQKGYLFLYTMGDILMIHKDSQFIFHSNSQKQDQNDIAQN